MEMKGKSIGGKERAMGKQAAKTLEKEGRA